jgi:hypothetical protein
MKFLHIASLTLGSVTALTRSHTTEILDTIFKQKNKTVSQTKPLRKTKHGEQTEHSYAETALQESLIRLSEEIGVRILRELKIKNGNRSIDEKTYTDMLENPASFNTLCLTVLAPIV